MAMRVAPSSSVAKEPEILRTSFGVLAVQSNEELNQLSKVVSDVIYQGPSHKSKYSPCKNKPKMKAKKKSKPAKVPASPSVAVKPVLPTEKVKTVKDDSERYAMWWSFHTDLSKGEYPKYKGLKVYDYPVKPEEKAEAERRTRGSKAVKQAIGNIYALGCTPRAHQGPTGLIGSCVHPGNPLYSGVVARNKTYEKELISRYCERTSIAASIGKAIPSWLNIYPDHLSITRVNTYTSGSSQVNVDDMISKLEQHINTTPVQTAKVEAVTQEQMNSEDAVARAEAEIFDLDLNDVLTSRHFYVPEGANTSAANDQSFVMTGVSITPSGQDQLLTPQEYLHAHKFEPLSGNEYAQYCISLSRMEEYSDEQPRIWYGDYEMSAKDLYVESRKDASRYLGWLHRHDVHNAVRTSVEHARLTALPLYDMELGVEVPAAYHLGEEVYDQMIATLMPRYLAAHDLELITNDSFSNVMIRTNNRLRAHPKPLDTPIVDVTVLEQEELINKITENAIKRSQRKTTFSEWNQGVAIDVINNSKATTESESSPTVVGNGGAFGFVNKGEATHSPRTATAEIVDLTIVRNERAEGMSKLLAAVKPKLAGLTPEQADGARLVLKEMLEMLG
jgi:hypothetical protein